MDADLLYKLATLDTIDNNFLLQLRLAMVAIEAEGKLAKILAYATHATGVILRAYKSSAFVNGENKVVVKAAMKEKGLIEVLGKSNIVSVAGVYQSEEVIANDDTKKLLFEASYINPDTLVEAVAQSSLKTDELYYKTSRGSNPDLGFGLKFLAYLMDRYSDINCYEGALTVKVERKNKKVMVNSEEISSIIGMDVEIVKIVTILRKLDFDINIVSEHVVSVSCTTFQT